MDIPDAGRRLPVHLRQSELLESEFALLPRWQAGAAQQRLD
jgi:hypothetical protein